MITTSCMCASAQAGCGTAITGPDPSLSRRRRWNIDSEATRRHNVPHALPVREPGVTGRQLLLRSGSEFRKPVGLRLPTAGISPCCRDTPSMSRQMRSRQIRPSRYSPTLTPSPSHRRPVAANRAGRAGRCALSARARRQPSAAGRGSPTVPRSFKGQVGERLPDPVEELADVRVTAHRLRPSASRYSMSSVISTRTRSAWCEFRASWNRCSKSRIHSMLASAGAAAVTSA